MTKLVAEDEYVEKGSRLREKNRAHDMIDMFLFKYKDIKKFDPALKNNETKKQEEKDGKISKRTMRFLKKQGIIRNAI